MTMTHPRSATVLSSQPAHIRPEYLQATHWGRGMQVLLTLADTPHTAHLAPDLHLVLTPSGRVALAHGQGQVYTVLALPPVGLLSQVLRDITAQAKLSTTQLRRLLEALTPEHLTCFTTQLHHTPE